MDAYKYTLSHSPRHYEFFIACETPEEACKKLELSTSEFATHCSKVTGALAENLISKYPNKVLYREEGENTLHALADGESMITFHLQMILDEVSVA